MAPRRITTMLGISNPRLIQAFGAREIAAGSWCSTSRIPLCRYGAGAGDAMDAAVLVTGLRLGNQERRGAAAAMLFVLGAAALDIAVASAPTLRE